MNKYGGAGNANKVSVGCQTEKVGVIHFSNDCL